MKKVCLLAFVLFTWSIVVNAQESDGRYVEVTGSSEIEVVPDEIHFLVQSIRGELSPCASENSNIRICQCIGNKVRLKH